MSKEINAFYIEDRQEWVAMFLIWKQEKIEI